ncbi:transposase, partial [Alteribacillus sp. JSM 102045]|uniref:transposase n=1 Tax=Alteribacillus sp. JSM 102045 TaxID=1562101 RepID=UPI0035BF0AB1
TLYARRKTDVESVFGHVKQNLGYQRFLLRGLEKVHVEFGWVALAHKHEKSGGGETPPKEASSINIYKKSHGHHLLGWRPMAFQFRGF